MINYIKFIGKKVLILFYKIQEFHTMVRNYDFLVSVNLIPWYKNYGMKLHQTKKFTLFFTVNLVPTSSHDTKSENLLI